MKTYITKTLQFIFIMTVVIVLASLQEGKAAEKLMAGGTFVVGMHADPRTLNPVISSEATTRAVAGNIFSRLIYADRQGNYHGDMAQKWTISKDNLKIQFELRKGAKWHDGKPVTAEDVKFSLESLRKYAPRGNELKKISEIVVLSNTSIEIRFPSPSVSFLPFLDETGFLIPKHIYSTAKDLTLHPSNMNPLGSGPFIFKEWMKGDHITLMKNKNYYLPDEPFVDNAIFKIIPSGVSRVLALETGDIDYLCDRALPEADARRFKGNANFVVTEQGMGTGALNQIVFNTRRKPWNDVRVRQAIALAIDRKAMVEKATFGLGSQVYSPFSVKSFPWAYNPKVEGMYPQDLAKAAKLLDEAGYPIGPDGVRFTTTIIYDRATTSTADTAEILREQLKAVNINMVLQPLDKATADQQCWITYNFDLWLGLTAQGSDPSIGIARFFVTKVTPPAPFTNANEYSNPEVDKLFSLASGTLDLKKRSQYYREAQILIMKDLPTLPLIEILKLAAFPKKVKGVNEKRFVSYHYAPSDAWFSK